MKKVSKYILNFFLWIIMIPLAVIIVLGITLQFAQTQKYLTKKITDYLSKEIKSKVELAEINIVFPKSIRFTDLYIEDLRMDTLLYSHTLKIDINILDIFSKKIIVNSFEAEKVTAHIYRSFPDTNFNFSFISAAFSGKGTDTLSKPAAEDKSFQFSIKNISLKNIYLTYEDTLSGINSHLHLGLVEIALDKFDLQKEIIHVNSISLQNTNESLIINQPLVEEKHTSSPFVFDIGLNKLDFSAVKFTYNNNVEGKDLRIDLGGLLVELNKFDMKNETLSVKSMGLSNTFCLYTLRKTLASDSSKIPKVIYEDSTKNKTNSDWIFTLDKLNLDNNSFGFDNRNAISNKQDIDFNHLQVNLKALVARLSYDLKNDNLNITQFDLLTQSHTIVKVKGSIVKMLDANKMYADLNLLELTTTKADIYSIVPKKLFPENIIIPSTISINGNFKGYMKQFDGKINAQTSMGDVAMTLKMDNSETNNGQNYLGKIKIHQFDLGKLLNQPGNLGPISLDAVIAGRGFDTNNIKADLNIMAKSIFLKGYEYKNITLGGLINKKSFNGKMAVEDTNLAFNIDAAIDLDKKHPKYKIKLDLKGADLYSLNLSKEIYRVSGLVEADINGKPGQNLTGTASIKNALLIKNNVKYPIDSILLISKYSNGISDISLKSEIVYANFNGNIILDELPKTLMQHLNDYFDIPHERKKENLQAQKFNFDINLIDPRLFTENLIPGLEKLAPSTIKGAYDSQSKNIQLHLNIPQVVYAGIKADSLKVNIGSDKSKLNYALQVREISDSTMKLENLYLGGGLENGHLSFQFNSIKDDSTKMIAIGGILKNKENNLALQFNTDLVLNNEIWRIDTSNHLLFKKQGFFASNLTMAKDQQLLSINSLDKTDNSPLEIRFNNFSISSISKIIENKSELVRGNIDGNFVLKNLNNTPVFTSDISIKKFAFKTVPVGDISIHAENNENPKKIDIKLKVNGNDNEISMYGYYSTENTANNIGLTLDIKNLNIASIEPFTFGEVNRMSGSVNGIVNIKGNTNSPDIAGSIIFKKCFFNPRIIDTYLRIDEAQMVLDSKKIRFNSFTIFDSLNNKAMINGYVDMDNLKDINLDLKIKTINFLAMNTAKKENDLYYGSVYLNSDISIKGKIDSPIIDAKVKLNKGTILTYVSQENGAGKNESEGIVEFVDSINHHNKIMTNIRYPANGSNAMTGIDLHATIDFDKEAVLKMIVDKVSGDSVYTKGDGSLDFSLNKTGKMSLIGKYKIDEGGYHLSVSDFVKKDFFIETESFVSWSGDIMDVYADINAVYEIKASPMDLLQDQLSGMSELEKNKYRNSLTFLVYLKMRGFISSPEISFDIQLPENKRGVLNGSINAKLNALRADETQLNKQVFALLTLNRFLGEDPFENGNGSNLSSAARTSASKVLTQQLNDLSKKYIKGVDINVGLNSFNDYSSGKETGRTQLEVGVSKQLFHDKLTIKVGGNLDMEGEKTKQNNVSDVAGNINAEYQLSDDGRYKLNGYRKNEYENPIEGELIKTGLGAIYIREYDNIKEIFSRRVNQ